jgi:hypothetical protein
MSPGVWWHRLRWSKAKFRSGFLPQFFLGLASRLPFFARTGLLRRCWRWLLLLLAHALQLFVDLLRSFDSVGVVWLGRIGRGGCSVGRLCIGRRDDGIALGFRAPPRLHAFGAFFGFGSVVEGGRVWIGGSRATLTRSENEFRWRVAVMMDEDHVAAGTVEQRGQNLRRVIGSVLAEDSLIGDAACDRHPGVGGDLMKDLVEAGVVRGD